MTIQQKLKLEISSQEARRQYLSDEEKRNLRSKKQRLSMLRGNNWNWDD